MSFRYILLVLGVVLILEVTAQPWPGKTFGGGNNEQGICLGLTGDHGYILVGNTRSMGAGSNDVYLVKVNQFGLAEWEYPYGILYQDFGMWVEQTQDLGYIIAGYKWGAGYGGEDVLLLKTDAAGAQQWKKYIGHANRDQGFCVKELSDGYIITGHTMSYDIKGDIYVVRTDSEGEVIWDKNLGTGEIDYSYGITQAHNGDFIVAGAKGGFYNVDLTIFKIPDADATLIRLDGQGEVVWQKFYGGVGHDWFWSVLPAKDDGYYCLGSAQSYGEGSFDMFLMKVDEDGEEVWSKTYGGAEFDYGQSIDIDPDGNLYLAGTTRSFGQNGSTDLYLVKTDAEGEKLWSLTIGGDFSDYGHCVRALPEGGCVIAGDYQWADGSRDMYLVGIDSLGNLVSLGNIVDWTASENEVFIFPNPFSKYTTVMLKDSSALQGFDLKVFNQAGQVVRDDSDPGTQEYVFRRKHLKPGVYYLQIFLHADPAKVLRGTLVIY